MNQAGRNEAGRNQAGDGRLPSELPRHRPAMWPQSELRRQLGRSRTRWLFGMVVVLPLIFVAAFAIGRSSESVGVTGFIDLATYSSSNFALFALIVSSDLLLAIVAAMFLGDSLPSEALWGSLRYLLTAPVPRARLLAMKLMVGVGLTLTAVVAFAAWSLVVGAVAYGVDPYVGITGTTLTWPDLIPRLAVAAAYIFLGVVQIGALAFFFGVGTDAPLAAVGGAMLVLIVSAILDGLGSLGDLRHALPMHYARAWLDLFAHDVSWERMTLGVAWAAFYSVLFIGLGFWRFLRKDILS